jgi:hypothetical protein
MGRPQLTTQDTANLFGNIENVDPPTKTSKSLDEVALVMFGQFDETKPRYTGNAGNRASVSYRPPDLASS